jgi:hypothetical protein
MPAKLIIPPGEHTPAHPHHLPHPNKPLRVQVLGLNNTFNQLFDDGTEISSQNRPVAYKVNFDQEGIRLANMAFRQLARDVDQDNQFDFILRYEYNTFQGKRGECQPWEHVYANSHPPLRTTWY